MSSESLHIDTKILRASQKVLLEPPLITSNPQTWTSIHAELHRQPPQHTPIYTTSSTVICVHTGEALEVEWWIEGEYSKTQVSYNQITLYPPQIERSIRWRSPKGFLLLCLEDNFAADILGDDSGFRIPQLIPQLGVHDPFIREIGQLLRQQLEDVDAEQPLYIESLSLALGVYLSQHYSDATFPLKVSANGLSSNQIQQVKDYIDAHLSDQIRLKDLAQLLGMSIFHFSRQFKEAMHLAPYQFVMNSRLTHAKELLRSQRTLNISEISLRCGFSSQSHFAHHFRKAEGVTPKSYRQDF